MPSKDGLFIICSPEVQHAGIAHVGVTEKRISAAVRGSPLDGAGKSRALSRAIAGRPRILTGDWGFLIGDQIGSGRSCVAPRVALLVDLTRGPCWSWQADLSLRRVGGRSARHERLPAAGHDQRPAQAEEVRARHAGQSQSVHVGQPTDAGGDDDASLSEWGYRSEVWWWRRMCAVKARM